MASHEEIVRELTQIAHDTYRTWDERLDALIELARLSDTQEAVNNDDLEESEALVKALMLDDRGKEFIIRAVLRLVSNA